MTRLTRYAAIAALALLAALSGVFARPTRAQSREDVIVMVNVAADRHHVDPDALGRVLACESSWRADVTGPDGSMGIAQWQLVTWEWASVAAGWSGSSPYDAEAAIDVMAWLVSRGGWAHWRACGG